MSDVGEEWCETPEQAARSDIPERFARVVGVDVRGDDATVWLLTNDVPPFEAYTVWCVRENGLWRADGGSSGLNEPTPEFIKERAFRLGWR